MTADSGWVEVVANKLYYRRKGDVVSVSVTPANTSSSWLAVGTLPDEAKPHFKSYYKYQQGDVLIQTDGSVKTISTNASDPCTFTYLV